MGNTKQKSEDSIGLLEYTTVNGHRIAIKHVPYVLIEMMAKEIPEPVPPQVVNKSNGQLMQNPSDPKYLRDVELVQLQRTDRAWDAHLSLGVRLLDPMPPIDGWIDTLKHVLSFITEDVLARYDLENPRDVDILYKRFFVVVTTADVAVVREGSSVGVAEVTRILKTFRASKN